MLFGIDLLAIVIATGLLTVGLISFHKIHKYDLKISKELYCARVKLANARHRAKALAAKQQALPNAFREENWCRSFYGEPTDENAILATTGCQLTDAIFHAAHEAGIDIASFYRQPMRDLLDGEVRYETIHGYCSDFGSCQRRDRCLG